MKFIHFIIQSLLRAPKFSGRDYLIENIPNWFLSNPNDQEVVNTRFGFKILLHPNFDKNIEHVIYQRGVYEQGTISTIQKLIDKGDSFIDVGANIGFLSLFAANIVGLSGHVYSFEPFPKTHKILSENKKINNFNQIEIHEIGLGNIKEKVKIYPETENRGGSSILNHQSNDGIEIQIDTLDNIYFPNKIKAIKIDVEGYEMAVLRGAKQLILKDKPALIVEYSQNRVNSENDYSMFQWILDLNIYQIFKLDKGKERASKLIEIFDKSSLPEHDNIFCIPKN